ncbi:DNA polymerase III subunit epsilon [Bosea sp. SSUT16]|jgi:DNA polymerase-3 subunit epsilon|uniref:DNA polymerase III subunit epsilon n=1 Tax=Bosea spartocytisi TaxID=2773451 RepID=A0A927EEW8_9HYPH|nr:DNA polymerase III subunit epsilon [Bosea spartocytisi]MBD3849187.1 DNA polymerase III subunit epsilon [Bosea spartocytisi]MCT4475177.1 DNA polymerase III subunit epsilon [Bosea spartocytisi]
MREIVLDTETTGVEPHNGDRIVEIGCVELINHCPSGRNYHVYINPERSMPVEAFNVHGLSEQFLSDKQVFAEIAQEFLDFIADARLVIHNAAFDVGFINMEFKRLGLPPIEPARVVDSLSMARRKHPGASNSLDALCSRYGIDNSRRTKHGALLDSEILAEVYIELIGGKQASLGLGVEAAAGRQGLAAPVLEKPQRQRPLAPRLDEAAIKAHEAFILSSLKAPLWKGYLGITDEAAQ